MVEGDRHVNKCVIETSLVCAYILLDMRSKENRAIVKNPYDMTDDEARARIAVALKRVSLNRIMHRSSLEYRDAKGRVGSSARRNYVLDMLSEAQNHRCAHCGVHVTRMEPCFANRDAASLEHIVPVKFGGPFHFLNMVMACWGCNWERGSAMPIEQLVEFFPDIEWQNIEIGPDTHLPPLSFSGTSTYLPKDVRDNAPKAEIMAQIPILYEEMARAEMPLAIEQVMSGKPLSRDDPRFMRLFGSMKSKRLKNELRRRLSGEQNHRCGNCGEGLNPCYESAEDNDAPRLIPIIPHEYGGPSHEINYAVVCKRCNLRSFTKRISELRAFFYRESGELTPAQKRHARYWKDRSTGESKI